MSALTEKRAAGRGLWRRHEAALAALLAVTCITMSRLSPDFGTAANIFELPRFFVEPGLLALAMTFVIITGGIDLSVGSIMALSAVVMGIAWRDWGFPIGGCVAAGLLTGALAGAVNGLIITRLGVPPLMVTLATMAGFRGVAIGISGGDPVSDFPDGFIAIGNSYLPITPDIGVPVQVFVFIVFAVIAAILLWRTWIGRHFYAIGHNETAARYAGINAKGLKLGAYVAAGLMSGVAATVAVARFATAKADAGTGMELLVITACVLGGIDINGGRGTVFGAVLGVLTISVLSNGLQLAGVGSEARLVVTGILLVVAVILGQLGRRGRGGASAE